MSCLARSNSIWILSEGSLSKSHLLIRRRGYNYSSIYLALIESLKGKMREGMRERNDFEGGGGGFQMIKLCFYFCLSWFFVILIDNLFHELGFYSIFFCKEWCLLYVWFDVCFLFAVKRWLSHLFIVTSSCHSLGSNHLILKMPFYQRNIWFLMCFLSFA